MSFITNSIIIGFCCFYGFGHCSEQFSYDLNKLTAQEAFEKGRLLRAQFKNIEGRKYLKFAAEQGDENAAYLLAMDLISFKSTIRTPPESKHYLNIAAKNGSRKAMQYLYLHANWLEIEERGLWKTRYYEILINLGKSEPAQVFYELAMYHKGNDDDLSQYYLERAIDLEHPKALMELAHQIEDGSGLFIVPGSRQTQARILYLQAAQTGYLPAILKYIKYLESVEKFENAYEWRVKAMEIGDLTSLPILASILTSQSENYRFVENDVQTAKAYFNVYLESAGRDRLPALYSNIEVKLTKLPLRQGNDLNDNNLIENEMKKYGPFFNHDAHWEY